jgi:hypothetical protein
MLLGQYVYALVDPRDSRVFYVGKGGGQEESNGNARVFAHLNEADHVRAQLAAGEVATPSTKVSTILGIWAANREVECQILRHSLQNESEAFHVEAAVIEALALSRNGEPDNDIRGRDVIKHGCKSVSEVLSRSAPLVNPSSSCTVFICLVGRSLRSLKRTPTDDDIYAMCRGSWPLGSKRPAEENVYAVAFDRDVSWGVYSNLVWQKDPWSAGVKKKHERQRWSFSASAQAHGHDLLMKNWSVVRSARGGGWNRGQVVIVRFDGKGGFSFPLPVPGGATAKSFQCLPAPLTQT